MNAEQALEHFRGQVIELAAYLRRESGRAKEDLLPHEASTRQETMKEILDVLETIFNSRIPDPKVLLGTPSEEDLSRVYVSGDPYAEESWNVRLGGALSSHRTVSPAMALKSAILFRGLKSYEGAWAQEYTGQESQGVFAYRHTEKAFLATIRKANYVR